MAFRFNRLSHQFVCLAALATGLGAAPGPGAAAQITGLDELANATPHARALRVLREMQRDSVKVDGRHWQAAQRCDRAAMEAYLRQLNELAAQARNVIRNAGLENDTSSNAITADQIVENIETRAKHAASRQPKNCVEAGAQEGTGGTGTTGGVPGGQTGSTAQQPPPPPPAPRNAGDEQRELARQQEAVQEAEAEIERIRRLAREGRCFAALHAANELEDWIDTLINPPRVRMGDLDLPAPPPPKIPPDVIQDWLRRINEALQECPEPQPQGTGTGGTGASNTGPPPQQEMAPQPPPPPAQIPRFNSGSPLDGIRNRAWSAMEEITDAYEKCDPERFEQALNELEQSRRDAKATADGARAAPEFRTVTPEEAQNLADELQHQIEQRRYILNGLKRSCGQQHRPGGVGTLLGPRRLESTAGQGTSNGPQETQPRESERQSNMPDLLNRSGGGTRERAPQDAGGSSENPGLSGGDNPQHKPSSGDTRQANEPNRDVRSRPARDRQRDRCDRPEGERPADCPNR